LRIPGFPIRTSLDHRVLARSPRLFAGSYVLHRLLLPRHPPCALSSYSPESSLASALHSPKRIYDRPSKLCARSVLRSIRNTNTASTTIHMQNFKRSRNCLQSLKIEQKHLVEKFDDSVTLTSERCEARLLGYGPKPRFQPTLLKEVIQPQVPLRLPCYDFTPVADLAVGAPLCKQLGSRLRARSTPVV
jgi:hypothetical protein